jgi:MOSC domain-containing protein YiiM/GNAT superfamily N-acetyltransferase
VGTSGRIVQVSVSRGGVPKLPIERAWVGHLGLEGDQQRERTVHGGPHRAVCLFGIEAIERLQVEGHPVEPGSVGENLTTSGIEWSTLPLGTRARIGDQLLLEVASPTAPCATQKHNFRDGRVSRISIKLHPSDSRMYARVLREGEVRPGDPIVIESPPDDSRAQDELLLGRLDRAAAKGDLATWRAAIEAGNAVQVIDDGELVMAAARELPGPAFNCTHGLARLPNLLAEAQRLYDAQRSTGWLVAAGPLWRDARPDTELAVYAASVTDVDDAADGAAEHDPQLRVRRIGPVDLASWEEVRRASGGSGIFSRRKRSAWHGIRARLLEARGVHVFLAELDGVPVGSAVLTTGTGVGWLRGGVVVPAARGRGIQRELIAARVELAAAEGCDVVGAWAEAGSVSTRNLERVGMRLVGRREQYRYRPGENGSARRQ